jgi:hypothetical protein
MRTGMTQVCIASSLNFILMLLSSSMNLRLQNLPHAIGRTPTEKMEKIQLTGSSSPYESNRASPTGGRRPLPFKRDLMGLSLSFIQLFYVQTLYNLAY